ncbi:hypothetical protein [Phaeodactylibacter xiamenensis]|uniref:hypothetical protein n=2 Tax=Phaeodactylibacter TaxID=1564515 RepID=UPI003CCBCD5E
MKKITLLAALAILMLAACEKDTVSTDGNSSNGELANLTIGIVRDYLPLDLVRQNSTVVFKNADGEEKKLQIHWLEEEKEKAYGNRTYESEHIAIWYLDESDRTYQLKTIASANYTEGGAHQFVLSEILTTVNGGFSGAISISADKSPSICDLLPSADILGKTFTDVYTNWVIDSENVTSFSRLYYTIELGVVGFEGWEGEMWVLDRFEE